MKISKTVVKVDKTNKLSNKLKKEPQTFILWGQHLGSEFIGTILLTFFLAFLAIILPNGKPIEYYFGNQIFIALYVAFILIAFLFIAFIRWSCDLNPAVSIYRILNGTNSYKYGLAKVFVQFLAAVLVGLVLWGLTTDPAGTAFNIFKDGNTLSPINSSDNLQNHLSGFFWEFFVEMLITALLVWPIFTTSIANYYRPLFICCLIFYAVLFGFAGGTVALNPARGLAQQLPAFFAGQSNPAILITTLGLVFGSLSAPFFLVLIQGLSSKYFSPLYVYLLNVRFLHKNKTEPIVKPIAKTKRKDNNNV